MTKKENNITIINTFKSILIFSFTLFSFVLVAQVPDEPTAPEGIKSPTPPVKSTKSEALTIDEVIDLQNLKAKNIQKIYRRRKYSNETTRYDKYPYEKALYQFEQNGKLGIADENGIILIEPVYDKFKNFAAIKDGKHGVVNLENQVIVPFEYDKIEKFSDIGYALAKKDGLYGYLYEDGSISMPLMYVRIEKLNSTLSKVTTKSGKMGMANVTGKIYIDTIYSNLRMDKNRFFVIQKDGLWGIKSATSRMILPIEYENIQVYGNSYIILKKDGKIGLFKDGQGIVIPLIYDFIIITNHDRPSSDKIEFSKNGKRGTFRFDSDSKTFSEN